jgi:hypothetical protein
MAKKKKGEEVKAAIRELVTGGISKSEIKQVAQQTGASYETIVKRMDAMNKAGEDVRLNADAANMVVKRVQKATPQSRDYQPIDFGTGGIGRTLTSLMGTPGSPGQRNPQSGAPYGGSARAATPAQLMIGGTQILPRGRIDVIPMGAAPAVADTSLSGAGPYDGMMDGPTEGPVAGIPPGAAITGDGTMAGDQYDFQSILDAITAVQQPQFDMSPLTDMFNTQFEQLSSQFDSMNPLRLAQLGRAYGSDAIRARQRMRKLKQDYRRGIPSMALGQSLANLANMAIGGGVTL